MVYRTMGLPHKSKPQSSYCVIWVKIKNPYKTQQSLEFAFKNLLKLGNGNIETCREVVEQSIANGWKGLFEVKNNKNQNCKSVKIQANCQQYRRYYRSPRRKKNRYRSNKSMNWVIGFCQKTIQMLCV